MNKIEPKLRTPLHRAFQRGMIIALGIAFIPLALISTGLFLSGYQPQDFNPGMRYGLIGLWLFYVFTADRIASFSFWHRIPFMQGSNNGELITVVVFAAIIASLRINTGASLHWIIIDWVKGFIILAALFVALYLIFRTVTRSWRRARRRVRSQPFRG